MTSTVSRVSWDIPKQIRSIEKEVSISGNFVLDSNNMSFIANSVPRDSDIVITQRDHFDDTSSKLVITGRNLLFFAYRDPNYCLSNDSSSPLIDNRGFTKDKFIDGLPAVGEVLSEFGRSPRTSDGQADKLGKHYIGCLEVLQMLHAEAQKVS